MNGKFGFYTSDTKDASTFKPFATLAPANVAYFGSNTSAKQGTIPLVQNISEFRYVAFVLCWAVPANKNFYMAIYNSPTIGASLTSSHYNTGITNTITITSNYLLEATGTQVNSSWSWGVNAVIVGDTKEDIIAKANEITAYDVIKDFSN